MILLYLAALLAPIVILIYVARKSPTSEDGSRLPRWPEWTPSRMRGAVLMGIASITFAVARLSFPFAPDEYCSGTFANAMNSSIATGLTYFDALYILAVPLMAIAVLRRDAKWAIGAVLLTTLAFGACLQASQDFTCPGFG